jgi:hypothetical protein
MDGIADLPVVSPPAIPRRHGRARIVLHLEDWPAPDRAAWLRACTPAPLLDDEGRAAAWRPASQDAVRWSYGRWLAFLTRTGVLADLPEPAERITPERVQAFVVDLREGGLSSVTLAIVLGHLVMAVSALCPGRDWAWLRAVKAALQRRAVPSRRKVGRLPCVIYARYSSDLQRAESIEDQVRACQARAVHEGWPVVEVFSDAAISGATLIRPGIQALMQAIRAGNIDVVLTESLEVVTQPAPELRIIDQDLWNRVQARLVAESVADRRIAKEPGTAGGYWGHRRPRYLLTGKVLCGCCNRPFAAIGKDYLGCPAALNAGCPIPGGCAGAGSKPRSWPRWAAS